jgi:hypothetical protein
MRYLPHHTGAIKITANSVPQFMLRRNRAAPACARRIAAANGQKNTGDICNSCVALR